MFILFLVSLMIGAVLLYQLHFSFWLIGIIAFTLGVVVAVFVHSGRGMLIGAFIFSAVFLGALRLEIISDQPVALGARAMVGTVTSVDTRLDKSILRIRTDESRFQASIAPGTAFLPGDHVHIRGIVAVPEDFITDSGRTFPYREYLAAKRVDALVQHAQVEKIDGAVARRYILSRWATIARIWIVQRISHHIAFPIDGVVEGMLVGFQGGLTKGLSDIFRTTGTLHTLVLSGYNITILGVFIGALLRRSRPRVRAASVAVGILALILLSGAGVAAVRAGIMGAIALIATSTLEEYNVLRALLVSFLVFFFMSPRLVFVDPGLHLSFIATFFIIVLLPRLVARLTFVTARWGMREVLSLAVGLPLFMLPYTMYFSGLFPIVTPLANIIMAPIIPLLMLGGLLVIVLSPLPLLAGFVGTITSVIGSITISVLTFLARVWQWQTPALSGWEVVGVYVLILGIIFRREILCNIRTKTN